MTVVGVASATPLILEAGSLLKCSLEEAWTGTLLPLEIVGIISTNQQCYLTRNREKGKRNIQIQIASPLPHKKRRKKKNVLQNKLDTTLSMQL